MASHDLELLAQYARDGLHEEARALLPEAAPWLRPPGSRWTPLHLAAHHGRLRVLRLFLAEVHGLAPERPGDSAGARIDVRDHRGRTALHLAARAGSVRAARLLVDAGARREARDEAGDTPVVVAAARCRVHVVELLLRARGVHGAADEANNGAEALAAALARARCVRSARAVLRARPHAAGNGDAMSRALLELCKSDVNLSPLPMVRILLKLGADIGATDDDGRTPLHHMAGLGWVDTVRFLLRHGGSRVLRTRDAQGVTPLGRACKCAYDHERRTVVRMLLRSGEDPTLPTDESARNVGQSNALHSNTDAFRILVEAGAWTPPVSGTGGNRAVHMAAMLRQCSQLKWFAMAGFKFSELKDREYLCPFRAASYVSDLRAMKLLARLGTDPRHRDKLGWSALHCFCASDDSFSVSADEFVQYLVESCHVDPDWREKGTGMTALHYAASGGNLGVIRALLRYGASIDPVCLSGQTPLVHAASLGHAEACRCLLEAGANVAHRDTRRGEDAFLCAVHERAVSSWTVLLEHGAVPTATSADGTDAIWALLQGLLQSPEDPIEHVKYFLELGVSPSCVDVTTGQSTLHRAAELGHSGVIALLLEHGADISPCDHEGRTPLQAAAKNGQHWCVSTLIERGADISSRDKDGNTALHNAVQAMNVGLVRYLLDHGSDVDSRDNRGWSPLMHAVYGRDDAAAADALRENLENDSLSVIGELLTRGANTGARGRHELSALHVACELGRLDVARLLILARASMETRTRSGRTPLHLAAVSGQVGVVRMLAQRGARVDTTDARGNSALSSACARGHVQVIRELLSHGAQDVGRNRAGRSALDLAARAGHTEAIVELLPGRGECVAMERLASPMAAARRHGRADVLRLLASYGAADGRRVGVAGEREAGEGGPRGETRCCTDVGVADDDELVGGEGAMVRMLSGSVLARVRRSGSSVRRRAAVSIQTR